MYRAKKKKNTNTSRILECIYRNAPIARTEISDETDITPATVTATVSSLIARGVVAEVGEVSPEENTSGRKRVLIDLTASYAYSIGIEFTQKALCICIMDLKGTVAHQSVTPFCDALAADITDRIISGTRQLIEDSGIGPDQIVGIGIAVPGHMDSDSSRLVSNRTTWSSFSPKSIEAGLPYPVVYENNARCMAYGKYLFDPVHSPDNFAFFHVGLGMFCANVIDGELFLGNNYVAGEIGHTIVCEGGRRCECGKNGCLQTYSSEYHLLKNARMLYENSPRTLLRELAASPDEITIDTVTTAYSMGDSGITAFISEALKYLGVTVSNIAIVMNPGKIFLHGQFFQNPDIRTELMDYIKRQLIFVDSTYEDNVEILPYRITDGAVGAGAMAIQKFFINRPR